MTQHCNKQILVSDEHLACIVMHARTSCRPQGIRPNPAPPYFHLFDESIDLSSASVQSASSSSLVTQLDEEADCTEAETDDDEAPF